MLKQPISITAITSISPLGSSLEQIWESYQKETHCLTHKKVGKNAIWISELADGLQEEIKALRNSDSKYKKLDNTVLYALYASRKAIEMAGWGKSDDFGINLGSSRGATALFEAYHQEFLQKDSTSTPASPTTTLGNISSWVAHDLKSKGPEISHSITCSTALHALLNGVAWIQGGMTDKFLVGGSEAPLTPFTIAQMKALKIYSKYESNLSSRAQSGDKIALEYPCRALDLNKKQNSMVLGEGAAIACLEEGQARNAIALVEGIGYATEPLEHNISISSDAICFQESMKMALGNVLPDEVDAIVMHAPGTIKGDLSEYKAIEKVFCNKIPFLTTNKWKVGHTFGTSGMLSLEMAVLMLQHQQTIKVPYLTYNSIPQSINRVMVNAVGFGGNAVSILLSKVG